MNESLINIGIFVTYGLVGLAAVTAIVFPVIHMFWNIRRSIPALIGIVVLALVVLLSYALSTNEPYENAGPIASQWISAGITTTMILAGLGVVAAVFTEIYKFIR